MNESQPQPWCPTCQVPEDHSEAEREIEEAQRRFEAGKSDHEMTVPEVVRVGQRERHLRKLAKRQSKR